MPPGPWVEVSGDFYGPFPDGSYWYVNHCDYSRFFDVRRIPSNTATRVIQALDELFSMLGIPIIYKTDNGPPFNSNDFASFAKRLGFKHRLITPYWPRANGEVERCMRNLTMVVQNAKTAGIPKEQELQNFLRLQRDTPHSTTKLSPSMLMFGRSNTSGIPSIAPAPNREELHAQATQNDARAKEKMKTHFDETMKTRMPQINVGSKVLIRQERNRKSDTFWDPNPFVVVEIKGSMVTAEREGRRTTRNSSFFKRVVDYFDEDWELDSKFSAEGGSVKEGEEISGELQHKGEACGQKGSIEPETNLSGTNEQEQMGKDKRRAGRPSKAATKGTPTVEETNPRRSTRIREQCSKKAGGGCDVQASQSH
jgi:hypothetical protein